MAMATRGRKKAAANGSDAKAAPEKVRLWLMCPPRQIRRPVIWELGQKFKVITNIRQASITDELGIVCLELEGKPGEVGASIRWLERSGINVEPVEINVL